MQRCIMLLPTAYMGKPILVPEFLLLFGLRNALAYRKQLNNSFR